MRSLFRLNKYFLKYKWRLLLGILFVTLSNLFAIYPAQVVRHAMDTLKNTYDQYGNITDKSVLASLMYSKVIGFAALIFGLSVVKGIFMFFMRQTIIVMSRFIEYYLKNEIFEHYQKLDVAFYRRNNTGDLMARISEDVGRVRMYIGPAIMYTINLLVMFVLVISTMISVNGRLTFFVLLPLPFLALAIYLVSSIIENRSDKIQQQLSSLSTFAQEAFSGIRVLKGFVREDVNAAALAEQSEKYRTNSLRLARVNALFFPIMLLLVGLSTLLTVYVGGLEVVNGRATFGTIAEFIYYVNMLTWPFAAVGWVTSLVQRAVASQKRINEFLETPPQILSSSKTHEDVAGRVEFRNVSLTYPDTGIRALDNISFSIPQGKTLAIVGKTGCGKSSVAGLLVRMFDASEGIVLIDGKDIRSIPLSTLRDQTGFVPQDVFLFSDTLANNIAFGVKNDMTSREHIEQAARDASVYANIIEFPDKFDTMLGERGITLSGGQKQRVAIARAIIKQPRILVFDDCLSAVDTHTEEEILQNLRKVTRERTTVIISHRVSTVKHADEIVVLDSGNIVEQGTHEALLEAKGYYHKIYEMQLLEEEVS